MAGEDQRRHGRIETSLECNVAGPEGNFEARVLNLSRGGAALEAALGQAEQGGAVMLLLERAEGAFSLALSATVVRVTPSPRGATYGLAFDPPPPDVDDELVRLLQTLAEARGTGRRASPRIAARVRVQCRTRESFLGTMTDLSRGGMSVRCPRPVEPGGTLAVSFGVEGLADLLHVSGEVVRVDLRPDGAFQVGVKFDPPTIADTERARRLFRLLLGLAPRQGVLEDEG